MKNTRFIGAALATGLLLAGCQATAPQNNQQTQQPPQTAQTDQAVQKDQKPGKLIINQVMSDGSQEKVMEIPINEKNNADVNVVPRTKGIIIDDNGFSMTDLTIAPGTKVIFQNMGKEDHWPASGDHETHDVCPGFDPGHALKPNETYEYTFDEVKICPFHDHLHPEFTGTITVKAEE